MVMQRVPDRLENANLEVVLSSDHSLVHTIDGTRRVMEEMKQKIESKNSYRISQIARFRGEK